MKKRVCAGKFWLAVFLGVFLAFPLTDAFAAERRPGPGHSQHQTIVVGRQKHRYYDGRFYRPTFFGFWFSFIRPPIGVVVASLPFGHKKAVFAGMTYYCHDNVYYCRHPQGYIVVPAPDTHQKNHDNHLSRRR